MLDFWLGSENKQTSVIRAGFTMLSVVRLTHFALKIDVIGSLFTYNYIYIVSFNKFGKNMCVGFIPQFISEEDVNKDTTFKHFCRNFSTYSIAWWSVTYDTIYPPDTFWIHFLCLLLSAYSYFSLYFPWMKIYQLNIVYVYWCWIDGLMLFMQGLISLPDNRHLPGTFPECLVLFTCCRTMSGTLFL